MITKLLNDIKKKKVFYLLRCTLAGMIPLMASHKYSVLTDVFYEFRRDDFDNIIKSKSWYLIREIPRQVASKLLSPHINAILARQKEDGLWQAGDEIKQTYDILSAFNHIEALDKLKAENKVKDVLGTIRENTDYYSLLIKSKLFGETSIQDTLAIEEIVRQIKNKQQENGSYEDTVFATVYHMEKLLNLGASRQDPCMQKAVSFLFDHINKKWEADKKSKRGVCCSYVFSSQNRNLEFMSARQYRADMRPQRVCFNRLGIMQNAYCIKALIDLGYETDAHVQVAMESILSMIEKYQGLCYFNIQRKLEMKQETLAYN